MEYKEYKQAMGIEEASIVIGGKDIQDECKGPYPEQGLEKKTESEQLTDKQKAIKEEIQKRKQDLLKELDKGVIEVKKDNFSFDVPYGIPNRHNVIYTEKCIKELCEQAKNVNMGIGGAIIKSHGDNPKIIDEIKLQSVSVVKNEINIIGKEYKRWETEEKRLDNFIKQLREIAEKDITCLTVSVFWNKAQNNSISEMVKNPVITNNYFKREVYNKLTNTWETQILFGNNPHIKEQTQISQSEIKHQFNIGDKVRIKTWEEMLKIGSIRYIGTEEYIQFDNRIVPCFTSSMKYLCNDIYTISQKEINIYGESIYKIGISPWHFISEMLEPYKSEWNGQIVDEVDHDGGCDVERCSICGGQWIRCGHKKHDTISKEEINEFETRMQKFPDTKVGIPYTNKPEIPSDMKWIEDDPECVPKEEMRTQESYLNINILKVEQIKNLSDLDKYTKQHLESLRDWISKQIKEGNPLYDLMGLAKLSHDIYTYIEEKYPERDILKDDCENKGNQVDITKYKKVIINTEDKIVNIKSQSKNILFIGLFRFEKRLYNSIILVPKNSKIGSECTKGASYCRFDNYSWYSIKDNILTWG